MVIMEEILNANYNLPPATFVFCFKPGEVHFESSSGNRVPWGNNKFFEGVNARIFMPKVR